MESSSAPEVPDESQSVPLLLETGQSDAAGLGALGYLSRAAQQSSHVPSTPDSLLNRSPSYRPGSVSPIKRILRVSSGNDLASDHPSDTEVNLVVVENPDGSLVEGMPSGFKHSTPVVSPPHTPRSLNFGITGLDLVDLFKRHERIFLAILVGAVLVDAIILAEEFTTVVGAVLVSNSSSGGPLQWGARLGVILPSMENDTGFASQVSESDQHGRHTFSVFPPHWQLGWSLVTASIDALVCLIFFVGGFIAYVSKQRKAYAWFGTISCGALVWQVILSCVDKLSLVLFLLRLASFTHARFMGDLMDDISLLATLMTGRQVIAQVEQLSVRSAADRVRAYDSTT